LDRFVVLMVFINGFGYYVLLLGGGEIVLVNLLLIKLSVEIFVVSIPFDCKSVIKEMYDMGEMVWYDWVIKDGMFWLFYDFCEV
ncbi:hypothetical protein DF186_20840, partial [Enterococcus hirae]